MKYILKYGILALFVLNLPGFVVAKTGSGLSSLMSYLSFFLVIFYYLLYLKGKFNMWLIYAGLAYFLIAGLHSYVNIPLSNYIILIAKYLILVTFGNSFFKNVSKNEMLVFLSIGALSIVINAFFFPDLHGRYGGFYLNPNAGGFICLIGYCLCFTCPNKRIKTLLMLFFTISGFLTFSRTFILVWILLNLISIRIEFKNIRILGIGLFLGLMLLTFGQLLGFDGLRFRQYQGAFTEKSNTKGLEGDSRNETWALFYDEIYKSPFFGNGFGAFQGNGIVRIGPHNTYILIIGEAGIIALLIFLALIFYLLYWSNKIFKLDPTLFLISTCIAIYLMVSHSYFSEYTKLIVTLFVFNQIKIHQNAKINRAKNSLLINNNQRITKL